MKKHVALSIVDQAALSALSLGLNVLLIAKATPQDFGHFVMLLSGLIFATSAQNALIFTPLNVLLPGRDSETQVRHLSMLTSINLLTTALATIAGLLLTLVFPAGPWLILATAAYFATSLFREYARNVFIVRDAVEKAVILDAIYIVSAALAVGALWLITDPVTAVVAGIAIANIVSLALYRQPFHFAPAAFHRHWAEYRAHWHETRWALQGALQSEAQTRGYVFITQAWQGPVALGTLQAGRVLLAPLLLIASAWGRVARPKLVALFHKDPGANGLDVLASGILIIAGASLVYGLAIAVAWPLVVTFVFHDKYPDMAGIVWLWWLQALFAGTNVALGTLLQARRQFRGLALVGMATAVACLVALLTLMLTPLPALSALYVLIASELLCGLGYLGLIFADRFQTRRLSQEPAE